MHTSPSFVALGGGHGLAASLSALRLLSDRITAIVTVADDGGSSGRLRDELDILPPGDLRMALAALCDDSEWGRTWSHLLQHRFVTNGSLNGHAVGNVLIAALWQQLDDPVAGLDWVARLLGARGRVLPMAAVPLLIEAEVTDSTGMKTIRGQSQIALTHERIEKVRLLPDNPPARQEAIEAIHAADWVILGPGSWFTSVMPHLLVPELSAALHETSARRCVVLNLTSETGETFGLSATDHIHALHKCAPQLHIDAIVADPFAVEDIQQLEQAARAMGADVLLRQVSRGDGTARHDAVRLAAAFRDVVDGFLGDVCHENTATS